MLKLFLLLLFTSSCIFGQNEYLASTRIDTEKRFVKRIWYGNGIVVTGKIQNHKQYKIASRIPICNDGSFCTALYRTRELTFFVHGYQPLVAMDNGRLKQILKKAQLKDIPVIDLGILEFKSSPPEKLRRLQAKVTLKNAPDKVIPVNLELLVENKKYLWQDHGYEGGAKRYQSAYKQKIKSNEIFTFENLSQIPYLLKLKAPGYISQQTPFDELFRGNVHFGHIEMIPASKIKFTYKARIRKKGQAWIEDTKVSEKTILCNGDHDLLFSKIKDGLGNGLDLRIRPKDDGIQASFFYYKRDSFKDLGKMDINELNDWDAILRAAPKGQAYMFLKHDTSYLFTIDEINKTQIQLLFHVSYL